MGFLRDFFSFDIKGLDEAGDFVVFLGFGGFVGGILGGGGLVLSG